MHMRRLTSELMAELALEALSNARRLLDDATHLYDQGRLPSAYMLAALAADELGKHVLITSFYGAREDSAEEWRKFWKRFRLHEFKLGDALWAAWVGDLDTEDPPPKIKEFHQRRLSATYVDVGDDGLVQTPSRSISAADVDRALGVVSGELKFCETALKGATPRALARHLEGLRSSAIAGELRSVLSDAGPIAAIAFAIALRAGLPSDEALAFARFSDETFQPPSAGPPGTGDEATDDDPPGEE
ncbi:MAG: AbiV family abortive infection protein [Propionibacteriales bacterium]|nr:AbiV family abortive infection protein [Propionibacteriales bacterium]